MSASGGTAHAGGSRPDVTATRDILRHHRLVAATVASNAAAAC
jgi:hypothetical protein